MKILKSILIINAFFLFMLSGVCLVNAQTPSDIILPPAPPPSQPPLGGPVNPILPVITPSHNPSTQPLQIIGGPSDPVIPPDPAPDPDFEGGLLIGETHPDNWTVIDFHDFGGALMEENDPFDVGGSVGEVVLLDSFGNLLVGNGVYDLGDSGIWNEGRNGFAVLQGGGGVIDFLNPVSGLGVFLNPQAFQYGGQLLVGFQSVNGGVGYAQLIYNGQPEDVNKGFFLGLWSNDVNIRSMRISTSLEYAIAIDDIAFTRATSAPEPATMALFATGMAGVLIRRKKR